MFNNKKLFPLNNKGFTLIEILVASTISSIILVMVYTSYRTTLHTIKDISGYAEFYENINLAVMKIDRDISNIYINRENKNVVLAGEKSGDSSKINFITVNANTLRVSGNLQQSVPISDIREVGYYLKEDKKHIGLHHLIRREQNGYDDDIESGGSHDMLIHNVISFSIEYKQRNDWVDQWDSQETRRFPEAMKITLSLKNYSGRQEDITFLSVINMK